MALVPLLLQLLLLVAVVATLQVAAWQGQWRWERRAGLLSEQ